MTTKNMASVLGACVIVIALVAWLRPPKAQEVDQRTDYLGDHITEVTGETLPRAINEARARGKDRVKITDPAGNIIIADITQPTTTMFWLSNVGSVNVTEVLARFSVSVERFHGIAKGEDGSFTFAINEVRTKEISGIMYEISVRVFNIGSTADWIIDIE